MPDCGTVYGPFGTADNNWQDCQKARPKRPIDTVNGGIRQVGMFIC